MRKFSKVGALSYAKLVALLDEGVHTAHSLAEETGLHVKTVYEYVAALRHEGIVHVCMWEPDGKERFVIPVFQLGRGKDAVRPKLTGYQKQQRARDKRKAAQLLQVQAGLGRFVQSANGKYRFEPVCQADAARCASSMPEAESVA